jgi:hypothetical protein
MSSKRAVWVSRLETWQRSGLSVAAFCRSQCLSRAQFVYWQGVLGDTAGRGRSLVPVVVAERLTVALLEVELPNGVRLRVPSGFPSSDVVTLVRGLGSC